MTARISVLAIGLVLLAGCAQTVKKEAGEPWPELAEQAEDCSGISGLYSARARIPGQAKVQDAPLLAYTLLPASPKLAAADRVRLVVTPQRFTVTALVGSEPILGTTYTEDAGIFECLSGTLEFRPKKKPDAVTGSEPRGVDWETIHLRRTQDGSLLLQKADGLANLAFMLFPIYLTTDNWYLFKAVERKPSEQ